MTTFDRVKILADKQKISIMELEERLGLGKNSLYGWKRKIPNGANLEKVADYFNVSVDYLLGRSSDPRLTAEREKEVDAEVEELWEILQSMPEEKRKEMEQRLLAYAQGMADASNKNQT